MLNLINFDLLIDYSSDNQSKLYFFQVQKYLVIQPI